MAERTRMVPIGALLSLCLLAGFGGLTAESAHALEAVPSTCDDALTSRPHILPEDIQAFQEIADAEKLEIVVMAPNPASLRYRSLPGYAAKTAELKACKSAVVGAIQGLVHCPESAFKTHADWARNRAYLLSLGYEVLGPEQGYLVRRIEDGKYFFSDYDLFSVRSLTTGAPAYSERLRARLNTRLGRRLVRHGPLADYELRADIPIKLPLLLITGGGKMKTLETGAELEREFKARGLPLW